MKIYHICGGCYDRKLFEYVGMKKEYKGHCEICQRKLSPDSEEHHVDPYVYKMLYERVWKRPPIDE